MPSERSASITLEAPYVGIATSASWPHPVVPPRNMHDSTIYVSPSCSHAKTRSFHPLRSMLPTATAQAPVVASSMSGVVENPPEPSFR